LQSHAIVAAGQRFSFAKSAQLLIADGIPSRFAPTQQQRRRGRAVSHRVVLKRSLEANGLKALAKRRGGHLGPPYGSVRRAQADPERRSEISPMGRRSIAPRP